MAALAVILSGHCKADLIEESCGPVIAYRCVGHHPHLRPVIPVAEPQCPAPYLDEPVIAGNIREAGVMVCQVYIQVFSRLEAELVGGVDLFVAGSHLFAGVAVHEHAVTVADTLLVYIAKVFGV